MQPISAGFSPTGLVAALCIAAALLAPSLGCEAESPPRGPESLCAEACRARAKHCTKNQCERGCNLVLDRLVEHEGDNVIACVSSTISSCDDRQWAHCAAWIGPHADGGPPPPAPSENTDDTE